MSLVNEIGLLQDSKNKSPDIKESEHFEYRAGVKLDVKEVRGSYLMNLLISSYRCLMVKKKFYASFK